MKLDARIVGGESPFRRGRAGFAAFCPGGCFLAHGFDVGQTPTQALEGQDAELAFGHVQPTAVLGRLGELKLLDQPAHLGRRKRLVQGGDGSPITTHPTAPGPRSAAPG